MLKLTYNCFEDKKVKTDKKNEKVYFLKLNWTFSWLGECENWCSPKFETFFFSRWFGQNSKIWNTRYHFLGRDTVFNIRKFGSCETIVITKSEDIKFAERKTVTDFSHFHIHKGLTSMAKFLVENITPMKKSQEVVWDENLKNYFNQINKTYKLNYKQEFKKMEVPSFFQTMKLQPSKNKLNEKYCITTISMGKDSLWNLFNLAHKKRKIF